MSTVSPDRKAFNAQRESVREKLYEDIRATIKTALNRLRKAGYPDGVGTSLYVGTETVVEPAWGGLFKKKVTRSVTTDVVAWRLGVTYRREAEIPRELWLADTGDLCRCSYTSDFDMYTVRLDALNNAELENLHRALEKLTK